VIDAGEQGNTGYRFNGIPDGIGVMDNGDGTLRVLVNHELGTTSGDVRAHGSKGAYVSDLTIDKATLSVVSGKDFLGSANDLFLASADGSGWTSGTSTAAKAAARSLEKRPSPASSGVQPSGIGNRARIASRRSSAGGTAGR